nr:IS630 family transposase [Marinicella sp. W31]MDC2875410.1 IS630 family transposase [Marinicella sp. W31]
MGSAISLRTDFNGAELRLLARQTRNADQARRLLALASIYDGGSRGDAARLGSVTVQIVRDWVVRFNARGPDGLINGKAPGKPSLLNNDQRTRSAYIFGAICPRHGKAAALVMPWCDTYAMNQHLIEISRNVAENAHAVLIMDQAGWHMSNNLVVPENITILPLPPKSPELNPVENIWQFMRNNWLSNRAFKSYEDIVDHCCYACRTLQDRPWNIMSIGRRKWAQEF